MLNRDATVIDIDPSFQATAQEGEALLDESPVQPAANTGWFSRLQRGAAKVGTGLKVGTTYVIAFVTAAPNALNALAAPSGQGPEKIGAEWWNSMSGGRRVYSLSSGASSIVVNTIMNALFIPVALQKLRALPAEMRKGKLQKLNNVLSLLLGVGGGVAAGSIAYGSFLWLPSGEIAAIPFAVMAFAVTFASRYISIKNIFNRMGNLLNSDARLQHLFANKLEHVNARHLEKLNKKLQKIIPDSDEPLTEDQFQALIVALAAKFEKLAANNNDFVDDAAAKENIAKYTALLFDMVFALSIMTPAFMTFTQKGFDGVNVMSKLISKNSLDDMHVLLKVLIGGMPGLASVAFYGAAGLDFRTTITSLVSYLYQNPRSIPAALGLLAANGIASNSMNNVGQGVISKPNNIFALGNNPYGSTFLVALTIGGAVVNTKSSVEKAFLGHVEPAARDITLAHVAKHLRDTECHLISGETASALREHHFLTKRKVAASPNTSVQAQYSSADFVVNGV